MSDNTLSQSHSSNIPPPYLLSRFPCMEQKRCNKDKPLLAARRTDTHPLAGADISVVCSKKMRSTKLPQSESSRSDTATTMPPLSCPSFFEDTSTSAVTNTVV